MIGTSLYTKFISLMGNEALTHPLAFVAGLLFLPFLAGTSFGDVFTPFLPFATHSEVENLSVLVSGQQRQIQNISKIQCEVQVQSETASLEAQLRTIDQERWLLQGVVSDGNSTQRDRDRLGVVSADKETLTRRLQKAMSRDCTP